MVSSGPAIAPILPPAAMTPKSRAPCVGVKRSVMTLQNTDTTNRLNTDSHTKNVRAAHCGERWPIIATKNRTKLRPKNVYTIRSTRYRGARAESHPKIGVTSKSVTKVAVIIQGSCCTPPSIAISSRTGRRM